MSHCGIYKIENIITHNLYIGKSKNIEKRWSQHKSIAKQMENKRHLYNSIRTYGIENFIFSIVEEIPLEDYDKKANEREKYWIKYYNAFEDPNNYNYTEGGDGMSGWVPSQEWRNKQSQIKKEWYQTSEGQEFKEKLSLKMKGCSGFFKDHKHTEEWKKQHSLDMKGEKNPQYGKHSNGKKCLCIELNKIFNSTREAAKYFNCSHGSIGSACRGQQETSQGYHWKYI